MAKPGSKPFWATTGDKIEPLGSKKAIGWLKLEKPPYQVFNWLFNTIGEFIDYLSGNAQYNIIVGGDSDERDYATMAAYIADSPTAGDRILIKEDEVLTATLVIPADIEVTMLKGNKFTLTTNFSPIIEIGNNVKTKGDFRIENSDTGTIAKAFSLNGDDNNHDNLIIENLSTGNITNALYVEASKQGNYCQARSIKTGAGVITNDLTDNSGNDENHVTVKGDNAISRSLGAKKFDKPAIDDFTDATHNHSDNTEGGLLDLSGSSVSRNHLPGGSFESWFAGISNQAPDGWELIGTPTDVSRDTGERDGYGGTKNVKIISDGPGNEGIKATLSNLKPSKIYTVIARGKANAGDTAKIWTTGASSNLSQTTASTSEVTLKGTFLTDATPTDVVLKIGSDNSGDIVWFDMILIIEGEVETPYIPHINDRYPLAVDYQDATPTNFIFGQMRIQIGKASSSAGGDVTVTYPQAFKQNPIVQATVIYGEAAQIVPRIANTPSPTSFALSVLDNAGSRVAKEVHWMAIGVA